MTAFARNERRSEWGTLIWELRSVNHRYLEVQPRLPEELRGLDSAVRQHVAGRLRRGKVDCTLRFRSNPVTAAGIKLNKEYLHELVEACREVEVILGAAATLGALDFLRWPGVIQDEERDTVPLMQEALEGLDAALDEMVQTRQREGDQISGWILARCDAIGALVGEAAELLPEIRKGLREKLLARLAELGVDADPGRLEQEIVLLAQKADVAEELDRLAGHLKEVREVLGRDEAVGRRLDFLMQELNREANTFGSKSVSGETSRMSVELKVLIEQMREQVQNVE